MLRRTRLGLLRALHVQYDGLCLSSAAFDCGHPGEAVRIANAIFVLLGPTLRNHKSIVDQLGYVDKLKMFSTADARGPHGSALIAVEAIPYVAEEVGKNGWIVAAVPFGHEALQTGRTVSLTEWWNEGILKGNGSSETLTRLQVVRILRDQDGGAHLDDHIKDKTYLAVQLQGIGIQYKPQADSDEVIAVEGALEATMRQMSHEVLHSLKSVAVSARISLNEAGKKKPLSRQLFESDPESGSCA